MFRKFVGNSFGTGLPTTEGGPDERTKPTSRARVRSAEMASGPSITVTCSQAFRVGVKQAAERADLPMTEYVRQAIRLREHLDREGWTAKALRDAEGLIRAGAWRD